MKFDFKFDSFIPIRSEPIDLTQFIQSNNYLNVEHLLLIDGFKREGVVLELSYIEIDTDQVIWAVFKNTSNQDCDLLIYNLKHWVEMISDQFQYIYSDVELYVRSPNCPKIQIFDHCIFLSENLTEILIKFPDDFKLKSLGSIPVTMNRGLNLVIQNLITDNYQIYNGRIYSLDYLPNDVYIEPQPYKLLFLTDGRDIILTNFFNRYQITWSDIIVNVFDLNQNQISDITIEYKYNMMLNDRHIRIKDQLIIVESDKGDLLIKPYPLYHFVQLSW